MNLPPPEPLEAVLRKHGCSELLTRDLSDAYGAIALYGPRQYLEREYLFAKVAQSVPPDELTKVLKVSDHFVFATGEPPVRYATRIGGVPYLAREAKWPSLDGERLSFVAQICLAHSKDLFDSLPGDVLLIFGKYITSAYFYLQVVWQNIEPDLELVSADDDLADNSNLPVCYGVPFRTREVPYSYEQDDPVGAPRCTKIGGYIPYNVGPCPEGYQFFGYLGAIMHNMVDDYEWLNEPRPLKAHPDYPRQIKDFMWGDCDGVPLFINRENQIRFY